MYLSALHNGLDYVICFTDRDSAVDFRSELGAIEFCEIVQSPIKRFGYGRMWLDGKFVDTEQSVNVNSIKDIRID